MEEGMIRRYDLIVIGGGPAGTSAAITAAREGAQVLLLERGHFPRHKVCGEFVSAESLTLLDWLLGDESLELLQQALPISESRLLLDGRSVRIPVEPAAASITRHDLDLALWQAAERAGVTTLQDVTVRRIMEDASDIETTAGAFHGRTIINAAGRWSSISEAKSNKTSVRWLGLKAHFRGQTETSVNLYFFRGGYCGVQPVQATDGTKVVNVCALVRTQKKMTWEELFSRNALLAQHSRRWSAAFAPLSTFPVTFHAPCPVSRQIFNAGDAAGFVDPFVGDGIALALRSGNLAARNVMRSLRGECNLQSALADYEQCYWRDLRPVYNASSLLRKSLSLPGWIRAPFLAICERHPRIAQRLVAVTRSRAA